MREIRSLSAPWVNQPCCRSERLVGAYLLANALGFPPTGRLWPAFGAVLVGVGLGRALRLRTGQHAVFLFALGAGLLLAAVSGDWPCRVPWWLVLGGIAVVVVRLAQLRTRGRGRH